MFELPLTLEQLQTERTKLKVAEMAPLTRTGYAYDWTKFEKWCAHYRLEPLPAAAETISLYATWLLTAGRTQERGRPLETPGVLKVSTAMRRILAVRHYHVASGYPSPITPEIRSLLVAAKRSRDEKPTQV